MENISLPPATNCSPLEKEIIGIFDKRTSALGYYSRALHADATHFYLSQGIYAINGIPVIQNSLQERPH